MTRLPLAVALLLLAPAAAQAEVTGAIGGLRDPATGYLELTVNASDRSGSGLRTVHASLGGKAVDAGELGAPGCLPDSSDLEHGCPATGTADLLLDTTLVDDGPQRLVVSVEDGAGAVTALVDRDVTVANTLPTWTSTVTLDISSGKQDTGGGPVGPSGETPQGGIACRGPRLSVTLATRPLRFRHGVPVLRKGRRYTFKGRLTCVVDGRRQVAPRGTELELRQIARGRTVGRRTVTVGANGQLRVRITARSRRAIVLRFRATGGKLVRVRIPVTVAPRRDARATAAQDPGTEVGGSVETFLGLAVDTSDPEHVRARVTATLGSVLRAAAPVLAAFRAPVANETVLVPVRRGNTVEITLSVAGP